jgi:STE24 endopeptidase
MLPKILPAAAGLATLHLMARRIAPALTLAAAAAQAAVLLLRPRSGLIEPVPVRASDHFSAEEIERARRYRRPQLALGAAGGLVETALLLALARRPPRRMPAAAAGALVAAVLDLAPLPIAALARRRSIRAGLTTDSWGHWGGDVAKSTAIGAAFGGAGSGVAVALMRRRGDAWWVPAAAVGVAAGAAVVFAGPVLLDPVFNRFTPLPDGDARRDVLELARRAGVEVGEVYVVDASRRTTAANAYVTGLGATKRVVLFDTLLDRFERDEVRVVVAHELGHVRHRDVLRGLAFLAIVAPPAARAVARVVGAAGRRPGPEVVPVLALAMRLAGAPLAPIAARLSRRIEARTDAFSLQVAEAPDAFVSFQRGIALRNLAEPDPPRLLRALMGTHPSTVERIGIAKAYRGT